MRESGDIEQDANLVLGLYTEAVEKVETGDYQALDSPSKLDPVTAIELTVLKNRGGVAGRSYTLSFNRPVYQIKDQTSVVIARDKTY